MTETTVRGAGAGQSPSQAQWRREIRQHTMHLGRLLVRPAYIIEYELGLVSERPISLRLRLAMLRHALHQLVFPDAS